MWQESYETTPEKTAETVKAITAKISTEIIERARTARSSTDARQPAATATQPPEHH